MSTVTAWPPGFMITVPACSTHASGIMLTRDEAFELLDKLRGALAAELCNELRSTPAPSATGGPDDGR